MALILILCIQLVLLHICSNIMNIFSTVQIFRNDTISILNILKENNSEKNGGLFLFSAYCPMKFYIFSKFHENVD